MKFGFESEKHLFSVTEGEVSNGVLRLVDALADYAPFHGEDMVQRATNEFVISMAEMNSIASESTLEVVKDYLRSHWVISDVAKREDVQLLPVGSIPFEFTPTILPKWAYYVQNSILLGKKAKQWSLQANSPLLDAANCAGLHVHVEMKTLPEYLSFTPELGDKHNLAVALAPLIAVSSSPYFMGAHEAHSMRGKRYYFGVYKNHPLNGGLPPMMKSSEEALRYSLGGVQNWVAEGVKVGFNRTDMEGMIRRKGANWGFVRWNRSWNTVEMRFLESDFVDLDVAKFLLTTHAFRRTFDPIHGPARSPTVEPDNNHPLTEKDVDQYFTSPQDLVLPNTHRLKELVTRAIDHGLQDPVVRTYVERIYRYVEPICSKTTTKLLSPLAKAIETGETTSARILARTQHSPTIDKARGVALLRELGEENQERFVATVDHIPDFEINDRDIRKAFPTARSMRP